MVKFGCEFCAELFEKRKDAVAHEKEGNCVRNRLDLVYRAMNQCVVDPTIRADGKEHIKYKKEVRSLLKLFKRFTGKDYTPSKRVGNLSYGKPLPTLKNTR